MKIPLHHGSRAAKPCIQARPLVLFVCLLTDLALVHGRLPMQSSSPSNKSVKTRRGFFGAELRQFSKEAGAKLVVRAGKIGKGRRQKTFPRRRQEDEGQLQSLAAYENRKKKDRQIKQFAESGIGLGGMWVSREDPVRRSTMNLVAAVNDIKAMQAKRGFKCGPLRRHPIINMALYNVVAYTKSLAAKEQS